MPSERSRFGSELQLIVRLTKRSCSAKGSICGPFCSRLCESNYATMDGQGASCAPCGLAYLIGPYNGLALLAFLRPVPQQTQLYGLQNKCASSHRTNDSCYSCTTDAAHVHFSCNRRN
eukprot:IDg9726t1